MTDPSFTDFFTAVHGYAPFPWQARLAEQVLAEGWPELLDLPTGAGKTSALDIALYCLARKPDAMPRRTVLVVDRRVVVDQGADRARALLTCIRNAADGPCAWIAASLRALWNATPETAPFALAVMRGGMPRDNDWARQPDQPVLGVSTVDQVGSRLLFRGYGVGTRSASIHAGLIGNDTLILLDEVHLAVPFAQTLEMVRGRFRTPAPGLPDRFVVVQMSATPGATTTPRTRFGLAGEDRAHPVLARRLSASKRAKLIEVRATGDDANKRQVIADRAVAEALALQRQGAHVVGLIVNRVDTARLALSLLRKRERDTGALLVTGRMRPIDRDRVVHRELLPHAGVGRDRTAARPLVVIATQCIEAGADLDFDGMVTECASLDALRQRFGRVDRVGELGMTASVILGRSDLIAEGANDPVYGDALPHAWRWLQGHAADGVIDLGIDAVAVHPVPEAALAPHVDAPVLLPAHVDAWSQTSPLPTADPDIALWLHGPAKNVADVQIVWRTGAAATEDNLPGLIDRLLACRPSSLEAITLPLGAARRWLAGLPSSAIADVVAGDAEASEDVRRRADRDGRSPVALRWAGEESRLVSADELRPGDVLVVDAERGGLAAMSFEPGAQEPVRDLGELAQLRGRGVATVRFAPNALTGWALPPDIREQARPPGVDEDPGELRARISDWLASWPTEAPAEFAGTATEWTAALRAFRSSRSRFEFAGGELVITAVVPRRDLTLDPEASDALTEDDDSSFRHREVLLHTHSTDVRDVAARFARAIGFAPEIVDDLALAGWFHDVGKADPRFQRWLVGGSEVRAAMLDAPLAKSALPAGSVAHRRQARVRAGYPEGYRHELLSLAMIEQHSDALDRAHDRDLVLHLVASHHGWCRPFAPAFDHPDDLPVKLDHGELRFDATTRHERARLDSGVSDRFWMVTERYGWWGLAWIEAVLRLADHRASEMETEVTP